MVLGGYPDPAARQSEIIDIIDPTRTCASLHEFPENIRYGPTSAIMNGSFIVCGYKTCYKYVNDNWMQIGQKHHISRDDPSYHVIRGNINTCTVSCFFDKNSGLFLLRFPQSSTFANRK